MTARLVKPPMWPHLFCKLFWHQHVNIDGFHLCYRCWEAMTPQGEPLGYQSDRFERGKGYWGYP